MQCSEFDSIPFRGKFYTWKTYRGGELGLGKPWEHPTAGGYSTMGSALSPPLAQGARVPDWTLGTPIPST